MSYQKQFLQFASFEDKFVDNRAVDFYSPNNTSDGMLKKAWIVGEDNQRYLLKGSFKRKGLEPFNEVLSGMIAQAINLEYIPYTIEVMNKTLFSKCKCFIDSSNIDPTEINHMLYSIKNPYFLSLDFLRNHLIRHAMKVFLFL